MKKSAKKNNQKPKKEAIKTFQKQATKEKMAKK